LDHEISPYAPLTIRRPLMLQRWLNLTFLHWRYPPAVIRALLPSQLQLDAFDGSAWVALTPFQLTGLRLPYLPALPWISHFAETNVRTYVRGPDGQPGVWFFTLEADRLLAVIGARLSFHLPYRWAHMQVVAGKNRVTYRSVRSRWFGQGKNNMVIEPGPPVRAGYLENFLTARYRLYAMSLGHLAYGQIDHAPWPLRQARVAQLDQNLFQYSGVLQPTGQPHVLYSESLDVRIGRLQWLS